MPGLQYLLHVAMPNFYFHVTTAYDILRHNGVPLTMGGYLGNRGGIRRFEVSRSLPGNLVLRWFSAQALINAVTFRVRCAGNRPA